MSGPGRDGAARWGGLATALAGRRGLATAFALCLAGAALAFYAAGRAWEVTVNQRAAPLPPETVERTGADLLTGLSAIALVAVAGAGALLATRGLVRRLLGVPLLLVGLFLLVTGLARIGGADTAWPAVCAGGGLLVCAGGLAAVVAGHRWPAMGTRYERASRPRAASGPRTTTDDWNALDRGEDPTVRGEDGISDLADHRAGRDGAGRDGTGRDGDPSVR